MKAYKYGIPAFLVLALALGFGCAKKAIRSEAVGYTPTPMESKESKTAEPKPELIPPDRAADLEKERKLKEEALREAALREEARRKEALREEALREEARREQARREKALQEEAARKEALAREAALRAVKLGPVYYDFDQWTIREDQREAMIKNSEWLKANPEVNIRLEGHCDERGTSEYNLALGQKRAEAAKAFLEGLGISKQRISTISYGEERPLDPGHDEAAWAKNRRVDVVPVR